MAQPPTSSTRSRAATLRIKRGAKTLSEIALGRAKLVVGGGSTAQLRLKNAGLPDECIVLDTRETPFKLESRLGPDMVLVNGWAVETATVKPGDRVEFSGITLELIAPEEVSAANAGARARPAADAPSRPSRAAPKATEEADPYIGRETAAELRRDELLASAAKLRNERESRDSGRNAPTDFEAPEASVAAREQALRRDNATERDLPPARGRDSSRQAPTDHDRPDDRVASSPASRSVSPGNATERDLPPARRASPENRTERDLPPARPVARDNATERDLPPARKASRENLTDRDLPPARSRADVSGSVPAPRRAPPPAPEDASGEYAATGFSRPPWLESVGDPETAGAKLYLLHSVVLVGRQGDLRVNHPSVSKKHARFIAKGGRLVVEDLGSTNGTWVNREKLAAPREVVQGDTVHFGAAEFHVHLPGAPAARPIAEPSMTSELAGGRLPAAHGGRVEPEEPPLIVGTESFPVASAYPVPTERELDRDEIRRRADAPSRPSSAIARNATEREIAREDVRRRAQPVEITPDPELSSLELDEPAPVPPARADRSRGYPAARDKSDRHPAARDKSDRHPQAREKSGRAPAARDQSDKFQPEVYEPPEYEPQLAPAPDRSGRVAVRTSVRAADDDIFPAPKRGGAVFAALGVFAFMIVGAVAGGWYAWPRLQPLLEGSGKSPAASNVPRAAATPAPGANPAGLAAHATPKPLPFDKRHPPPALPSPTLVAMITEPPPTPTPIPSATLRPGQSLLDGEKVDIGDDNGRLNNELASLEQGNNNQRLRAERQINADSLQSIYVDNGDAVIRRMHGEDGFTLAPSAADAQDSEERRAGAKQISGDRVNQLIRAHFGDVKRCLVGGRFKGGRARVVVQFTIQPTGKVGESSVVESDVAGGAFKSCVAGVVKRITFPKPKDQAVVVQFPFVFTLN